MVLNDNDIDLFLIDLVNVSKDNNLYAYMIFESLYNTGLRINELIDYSRLSDIDTNTILVTTQKFSNPRIISKSSLNSTYLSAFLNSKLAYYVRSYSFYSNYFINHLPTFKYIKTENKLISTHLFRHNYIKKLYNDGKTVSEISSIIGERSDANTFKYISSTIEAF